MIPVPLNVFTSLMAQHVVYLGECSMCNWKSILLLLGKVFDK